MEANNTQLGVTATRRGVSLIELLGVMAVIVVLAGIAMGGIITAQGRARVTAAATAIDAYRAAFTNACISHPGVVNNRATAWSGESSYTSQQGLKKVVAHMNEFLDDELALYWDTELKCYVSMGLDPWNGHYILTEYPELTGTVSYFDPTVPGNQGIMALAIWVGGNTDAVQTTHTISQETYGIGLLFNSGIVTSFMQGFENTYTYTDYTVRMQ